MPKPTVSLDLSNTNFEEGDRTEMISKHRIRAARLTQMVADISEALGIIYDETVRSVGGVFTDVAHTVFEATFDSPNAAIDLVNGNVQDITLTEDSEITITGATAGEMSELMLTLIGDYDVTWPTSITWLSNGGYPPVLTGNDLIMLMTKDGGASWMANYTGAL